LETDDQIYGAEVRMKILVLADDESVRNKVSSDPADVLISCGDLDDGTILHVAELVECSQVLAVKGNHDSGASLPSPIVDLHLKTHVVNGISFGGFRGSWRYKPIGHFLYEQDEVDDLLEAFPPVDVFIAHNSPRRIHDREDHVHFGFEAFVKYIETARPRLFLHGHQHVNRETPTGATRVIGVYGQRRLEL
jgi:uncharacterized protein